MAGHLLIKFPSKQSFFRALPVSLRSMLKGVPQWLKNTNKLLFKNRQVVIIQVGENCWIVLGRKKKIEISYFKIVFNYIVLLLKEN